MKKRFAVCALLALACWINPSSAAASTITLVPTGTITGSAGNNVGWGFTLTNNTSSWISVTSSALTSETNPLLGTYTDFIGLQGGPTPSFAIAPFSSWSESFDVSSQKGLGAYAIAANALVTAADSGTVIVFYDIFNGDPTISGVQTGSSQVSAPFTVSVTAAPSGVPEPATGLMVGGMLLMVAFRRIRPQ